MDYFGGEGGDENIEALKRILGTFALYDPQLGIVHVMLDIVCLHFIQVGAINHWFCQLSNCMTTSTLL